jgi:hypothetical protein
MDDVVYIGGEFTGTFECFISNTSSFVVFLVIDKTNARYLVTYDRWSGQLRALDRSVDGPVEYLACDRRNRHLYVAGRFLGLSDGSVRSQSILRYDARANRWQPLGLSGLNGAVSSMRIYPTNGEPVQQIWVSGRFTNTADEVLLQSGVDLIATGSNVEQAQQIVCNTDSKAAIRLGSFNSQQPLQYLFSSSSSIPISFTLHNPANVADGIKTFRLTNSGTGEVIRLRFAGANGHQECDSECPLAAGQPTTFYPVNRASMSGFSIYPLTTYGSSAALCSLSVQQLGASLSGVPRDTRCNVLSYQSKRSSDAWKVRSISSNRQVLVMDDASSSATQRFDFTAPVAGTYVLNLDIAGCTAIGDCSSRRSIDVQIFRGANAVTSITKDTNTVSDRLDEITRTAFAAGDQISVILSRSASTQGTLAIHGVRMTLVSQSENLNGAAVLDIGRGQWTRVAVPNLQASFATHLGSPQVHLVADTRDILVKMSLDASPKSLRADANFNGRLNDAVAISENVALMVGDFTAGADIKNIAVYDAQRGVWIAIKGALNGPVNRVWKMDDRQFGLAGNFSRVLAKAGDADGLAVTGFAVFDSASLTVKPSMAFAGELVEMEYHNQDTFFAGRFSDFYPLPSNDEASVNMKDGTILARSQSDKNITAIAATEKDTYIVASVSSNTTDLMEVSNGAVNQRTPIVSGLSQRVDLIAAANSGIMVWSSSSKQLLWFENGKTNPQTFNVGGASSKVAVMLSLDEGLFQIVIGGSFDSVGGSLCQNLCFWSGQKWHSVAEFRNFPVVREIAALKQKENQLVIAAVSSSGNGFVGFLNLATKFWSSYSSFPLNGIIADIEYVKGTSVVAIK